MKRIIVKNTTIMNIITNMVKSAPADVIMNMSTITSIIIITMLTRFSPLLEEKLLKSLTNQKLKQYFLPSKMKKNLELFFAQRA